MANRSGVLEFTILGLLAEQPLHGYELRKRLNLVLGSFRAISYGSLYPCLRDLESRGLIAPVGDTAMTPVPTTKRSRTSYALTTTGHTHFAALVDSDGPETWEDEAFAAHFAFFAAARAEIRVRILEGRRTRISERLNTVNAELQKSAARDDSYTTALQQHSAATLRTEIEWLSALIEKERKKVKP